MESNLSQLFSHGNIPIVAQALEYARLGWSVFPDYGIYRPGFGIKVPRCVCGDPIQNGWLRLEVGEGKTGQGRMSPLTAELRALLESQRAYVSAL
jgi:hypothetical protein